MTKIFFVFLFVGFQFSQGSSDSAKITELTSKMDSLSAVVKESQIKNEISEKTLKAYQDAEAKVTDYYKFYVGLTVTLFLSSAGILGFFMYRRNKEEQAMVGDQVVKNLTPMIDSKYRRNWKESTENKHAFEGFKRDYNWFIGDIEKRIRALEDLQTRKELDSLQTKYSELEVKLRESFAAPLIRFSQQQFDNKEFQAAFKTIFEALQRIDPREKDFKEGPEYQKCISTIKGFLINTPVDVLESNNVNEVMLGIVKFVTSRVEEQMWEIWNKRLPNSIPPTEW